MDAGSRDASAEVREPRPERLPAPRCWRKLTAPSP